jgi:hypothetical protein
MPGIGEVMDGAMQHAPQPGRHSMRDPAWTVKTMAGSYALKHTFENPALCQRHAFIIS